MRGPDRLLSSLASVQQDADMTDHAFAFSNNAFLKVSAGECGHVLRCVAASPGTVSVTNCPGVTLLRRATIREASRLPCVTRRPATFRRRPTPALLPCARARRHQVEKLIRTHHGLAMATTASPCPCCAPTARLGRPLAGDPLPDAHHTSPFRRAERPRHPGSRGDPATPGDPRVLHAAGIRSGGGRRGATTRDQAADLHRAICADSTTRRSSPPC